MLTDQWYIVGQVSIFLCGAVVLTNTGHFQAFRTTFMATYTTQIGLQDSLQSPSSCKHNKFVRRIQGDIFTNFPCGPSPALWYFSCSRFSSQIPWGLPKPDTCCYSLDKIFEVRLFLLTNIWLFEGLSFFAGTNSFLFAPASPCFLFFQIISNWLPTTL